MITSLALTVRQHSQRPLHVPRCTLSVQKDHFELVTQKAEKHSSSQKHKQEESLQQLQEGQIDATVHEILEQHHLEKYRPLEPKTNENQEEEEVETFVVRIFFKDIMRLELLPEICQIIISTQSPATNAFFGPAAPNAYQKSAKEMEEERKRIREKHLMKNKFPGTEENNTSIENNIENEEEQQNREASPTFVENADEVDFSEDNSFLSNLNHQQQLQFGHQRLGGIRRQYICIFKLDHETEAWYKFMTEAIEDWTELVADGKRFAESIRVAQQIDQQNSSTTREASERRKQRKRKQQQQKKKKKKNENGESEEDDEDEESDDDLLASDDVEAALSLIGDSYNKNEFGWSSPKQNLGTLFNNNSPEAAAAYNKKKTQAKTNLLLNRHKFPFDFSSEKEIVEERIYQEKVEKTKRRLIPMFEDLEQLRDKIVNTVADGGVFSSSQKQVSSSSSPPKQKHQEPEQVVVEKQQQNLVVETPQEKNKVQVQVTNIAEKEEVTPKKEEKEQVVQQQQQQHLQKAPLLSTTTKKIITPPPNIRVKKVPSVTPALATSSSSSSSKLNRPLLASSSFPSSVVVSSSNLNLASSDSVIVNSPPPHPGEMTKPPPPSNPKSSSSQHAPLLSTSSIMPPPVRK